MSSGRPPNPEIPHVRNFQPKSRDERGQSKDDFEKSRLKSRTGGFQRYTDPAEVLTQPPDSLGYADDADRFNRDTTGEEKIRRDVAYARKEMIYYNRRTERADREESRWKQVEEEYAQDEQAVAAMRDKGDAWRRNRTSVPYHLLSMQYCEDGEGEKLRYSDDQVRVRRAARGPWAPTVRARPRAVRTLTRDSRALGSGRVPCAPAVSRLASRRAPAGQGQHDWVQPDHWRASFDGRDALKAKARGLWHVRALLGITWRHDRQRSTRQTDAGSARSCLKRFTDDGNRNLNLRRIQ
jgi:hypothetical protein